MRRLIAFATVLFLGLIPAIGAAGGGTWLHTIEDSYDPGDEVTAVAYVGAVITDEPVLARMSVAPILSSGETARPGWIELGPMTLEPTGLEGYLQTRVSITFTLPDDLEPGTYVIEALTESGAFFGDLLGTYVVVGAAGPSEPRWIEWALDDPLIEELPDNAVIAGPGFAVSVVTLRAGQFPTGAEAFMLHPEDLPPSTTTAIPSFVVRGSSVDDQVAMTSVHEEPPLVTANIYDEEATIRGAEWPAAPPPSSMATESGQPFELSMFATIVIVAGTVLVGLTLSVTKSRSGRHVVSVEPEEAERVLTRT